MTNQYPTNELLIDQIEWHWSNQLRPRLDGLTDEEYFWQPVAGCWTVRPADSPAPDYAPIQAGTGSMRIDWAMPEPDPAPVTTIAWRLGHVIVGVLAVRNHAHFDAPPTDYFTWCYAATASEALDQLDEQYARWRAGVSSLGEEGLQRPCGEAEGPFADDPLVRLVLHINRELIHHGAEIALLRDLYRAR